MPAPNSIRAGAIFMELFIKDGAFRKSLRAAEASLTQFGAKALKIGAVLTAFGAALQAPLIAAVETFRRTGDALDKLSQRTGITVENLSALAFASEQSGQTMAEFEKTIVGLSRQLFNLERQELRAVQAFGLLGVTFDDIKDLSPDEVFLKLADGVAAIENPLVKAGRAQAIFGRSGRNLLPLLNQGSEAIREYIEEAKVFGIEVGRSVTTPAAEMTDAFNEVNRSFRGLAIIVGSALGETITNIARSFVVVTLAAQKFAKQFPNLVPAIAGLGAVVAGLGVLFIGLGSAAIFLSLTFTTVIGAIATLASVFAVVGLPVAAAVLLIAQFADVVGFMRDSVQGALSTLGDRFQSLSDRVGKTFRLIANAVRARNIEAATELLWANVLVIWTKGQLSVVTAFQDFREAIVSRFTGAIVAIRIIWANLVKSLTEIWNGWQDAVTKVINRLVQEFQKLWTIVRNGLSILGTALTLDFEGVTDKIAASRAEIAELEKEQKRLGTQFDKAIDQRREKLQAELDKDVRDFEDALQTALGDAKDERGTADQEKRAKLEDALASAETRLAFALQRAEGIRVKSEKKAADAAVGVAETFDELSSGAKRAGAVGIRSTFEGAAAGFIFGAGPNAVFKDIAKSTAETARTAGEQLAELRKIENLAFQ